MINKNYYNILVISYSCFSSSKANGRTLENLFNNWDKTKISQLYFNNEIPDSNICENYYRIIDTDLFNYFKRKKVGNIINNRLTDNDDNIKLYDNARKYKKNIKMKLFRNIFWNMNLWKTKDLYNFIEKIKPDLIFGMAGDNYFVDKIILNVSKKYKLPILIYNCEDYQFKNYAAKGVFGIFFSKLLKKSYDKLMKNTSYMIYSNQGIKDVFDKKYSHINNSIIYNPTPHEPYFDNVRNEDLRISYLGNLGVGRHVSLIEIAEVIHEYNENLYLDVYGSFPNENIERDIKNCKGIKYQGLVSYEKVIEITKTSDIVVHTESFDDYNMNDKKNAFSTKISDCLALSNCFFYYGPDTNIAMKYLKENEACYTATNRDQMKQTILNLLENHDIRNKYKNNANNLVISNHNISKNTEEVHNIINSLSSQE